MACEEFLGRLFEVIQSRKLAGAESSYVASLFAKGMPKIAQKVGEEAVETVIAAMGEGRAALVSESADLLFHLMILWAQAGITPEDVLGELKRREGVSGLEEKAARK